MYLTLNNFFVHHWSIYHYLKLYRRSPLGWVEHGVLRTFSFTLLRIFFELFVDCK